MRRQYQYMNDTSGVGVLDKAVSVLAAAESGPTTLAQLVDATGLARPTAHRIAVALERHRLLARDVQGRVVLGPRIAELASAAGEDRLLAVAQPVLIQLRDATGESAQLYRRQADVRVCVAVAERASGLRGAADDRGLGRPGAARLGGGRADAPGAARRQVHRHHAGRRPPPGLGGE